MPRGCGHDLSCLDEICHLQQLIYRGVLAEAGNVFSSTMLEIQCANAIRARLKEVGKLIQFGSIHLRAANAQGEGRYLPELSIAVA